MTSCGNHIIVEANGNKTVLSAFIYGKGDRRHMPPGGIKGEMPVCLPSGCLT